MRIASGDDIAHLRELDQKHWTVLSCPTDGLGLDPQTLRLIDTDADGKIRAGEVISAAEWLTSVIADKDSILEGASELKLSNIDSSNPLGKRLYDSAHQILANLGKEGSETISLSDASDSVAIFAGTKFNGDGIITAASADDESLKAVIGECIGAMGGLTDRSGEQGVDSAKIEGFYAALSSYSAWCKQAEEQKSRIFPFGANTATALSAMEVVKDKVDDFFKRCSLLKYDEAIASATSISVSDIASLEVCPLAHPNASGVLPFDAINPAWSARFDAFRSLVLDGKSGSLDKAQWDAIVAGFAPYTAYMASKAGAEVESLGLERVRAILDSDQKGALLELVSEDKALEQEANSIDDVKKLMLLYRDFYRLLKNYVIFTDFYDRANGSRASFEVGQLYIDQRCCDLCIRVADMGKHADMPSLSGMFLIYCTCVCRKGAETMNIVAVMTDGETTDLRPGKNGIFYDLSGRDWDATIAKIVDNPISIKQAFWSPYRKFWEFCVGLINKSAADKDAKIVSDLQAKAAAPKPAEGEAKPQSFDIAKFAGIFAALGMALGYIGSAVTKIIAGVAATPLWKVLLGIVAIILVISGPSCFIAWSKLRKRNLGPVLNANGWAINSRILVNILFGAKLTSVAKYPRLKLSDPYTQKAPKWRKWVIVGVIIVAVLALVAFLRWEFVMAQWRWFLGLF